MVVELKILIQQGYLEDVNNATMISARDVFRILEINKKLDQSKTNNIQILE